MAETGGAAVASQSVPGAAQAKTALIVYESYSADGELLHCDGKLLCCEEALAEACVCFLGSGSSRRPDTHCPRSLQVEEGVVQRQPAASSQSHQVHARKVGVQLRVRVAAHHRGGHAAGPGLPAARHYRLAGLPEHGRGRALQRAAHARLMLLPLRGQLGRARHLRDILGLANDVLACGKS